MRIDKLEIDGFGKFHNYSLTLKDGFNLIFGENESGKSTLCAFLLSMFYEMPNDGKRMGLSESIRRKYKPWNAEHFGGRVYFTDGGKQYIIEKSFGTTKRTDRARLLDSETWEECGDAENVGERFFGLGREGFLKTIYIAGLGADLASHGDEEILARLSNMETSGDEDVSYENVKNALEKAQTAILTKTGRGGKLFSLREEETNLRMELAQMKSAHAGLQEKTKEKDALKEKADALRTELKEKEKMYQTALMHEKFLAQKKSEETKDLLQKQLNTCKEKVSELQNMQKELTECANNDVLSLDEASAKELEKQLIILENKKAEAENKEHLQQEKNALRIKKQRKRKTVLAFTFFILFAILLCIGIFQKSLIFGFMSLICALFAVFVILTKSKTKAEDQNAVQSETVFLIQERIFATQNELAALCKKYGTSDLTQLTAYITATKTAQSQLPKIAEDIKEQERQIDALNEELKKLFCAEPTEFSQAAVMYDGKKSTELLEEITSIKEKTERFDKEYYELSVALAKKTGDTRSVSDIESNLLTVREQIAFYEKQHAAYEKALEWLLRAQTEIKQNYAPRLNQKIAEIFSRLTFHKYSAIKLGDGFSFRYRNENNETVEAEHLSCGTYDLLYVALRFAALSLLTEEKIPPVILDDALLQLDDERLKSTVSYMCTDGAFGQILYFTCHKQSIEIFMENNVNKIEL